MFGFGFVILEGFLIGIFGWASLDHQFVYVRAVRLANFLLRKKNNTPEAVQICNLPSGCFAVRKIRSN